MSAALAASVGGASVLILEKSEKVGGTSAMSGAGTWIPVNHHARAAGISDSPEEVLAYLRAGSAPGWAEKEEPLRAELRAFLDCVRTRQTPKVDGLAGRRALELADQVMAGILEHGRRVQLGAFASPQGK